MATKVYQIVQHKGDNTFPMSYFYHKEGATAASSQMKQVAQDAQYTLHEYDTIDDIESPVLLYFCCAYKPGPKVPFQFLKYESVAGIDAEDAKRTVSAQIDTMGDNHLVVSGMDEESVVGLFKENYSAIKPSLMA